MFQMDEELFKELHRECCWFTLPIFEKLPDIDPDLDVTDKSMWSDDVLVERHIFAMIFGGFGYSVDLSKAKVLATIKLLELEKREPEYRSPDNPEFVEWISLYAQYNILLGTVFAYLKDYPLSAALLMNGLKTRAVNLCMPYCDFIKCILSKVEAMPSEVAHYDGCGFSAEDPMGSTELDGGALNTVAAEVIISALEGENGEIILSHRGWQRYGGLRRLGSTHSAGFSNCIDIYEVLMVDRSFNLKKVRFYFNGYFAPQSECKIKLPKGFRLDPLSEAAQFFGAVK